MTSQYKKSVYWTLAVCLCLQFSLSFGVVQAQEHEEGPSFEYDGPNGPDHWSTLRPNDLWAKCSSGRQQSPMRLTPNIMVTNSSLGDLDADYSTEPVGANIKINEAHGVEVTLKDSKYRSTLKINDVTYHPTQMHFHMGSEHKLLGHSFPMELHLVHVSADVKPKVAVIAFLFVKGDESPFLAQFADKLPLPSSYGTNYTIDPITLPKLEKSYARYQGSLTTPPCTEDVTWTVMLWNFPTISERQLQRFKAAMPKKNARTSQPYHGRKFAIRM